ncbi:SPFH domain-containing protein [Celerinatantimonas diazotrophica]|uniref:SPFH domain-containing protein n=1 Tax=Celerinatantimonas diazotrophica TaxID=412034 RepID=A0A4V2PPR0_9GAMM|nr:stomatin-like protein [Celerinatantimonas diazotrophica]TCK51951.1 SPFH domain-containing protein [Celerinatantimonas diazotrophica]CAG9296350.1 Protein QmcA [Celerinatantimonas diazotrophica]
MDINISTLITAVIALLIVITIVRSIRIVPQAQLSVIERLGRFHRVLHGGLHFIVPFVDHVRSKFTTQEQLINLHPQSVITKDNVSITIDGLVYLRVNDAQKATYEITDLRDATAQLAQTTLRAEIGKMELDETLSSREEMNQALQIALDQASASWGAKVTRVEISDISVPQDVQSAMELQLRASRERRAIETQAAANKNRVIAEAEAARQQAYLEAEAKERMAEADKKAQILMAEGQRQGIELIAQALKENAFAGEYILTQERIKAWNGIAASDSSNKIVVPYEAADLVGSLSVVSDLLKGVTPKN